MSVWTKEEIEESKSVNVSGSGDVVANVSGSGDVVAELLARGIGIKALAFGGCGRVAVVVGEGQLFRSIKCSGTGGRLVDVVGRKGRSGLIRRMGSLGWVGTHDGFRDKQSAWRLKRPGRYLI